MEVRKLEMFLAVVDTAGFTRAAEAMYVSQPALSQAIKELESELGAALFFRMGRRVELTPAGEALVGPARQVMRDLAAGRAAVQAVTGLTAGRLDLGALPTLAADPMARLIGVFRRRYPEVTIRLESPRDIADLLRMVGDGTCELGLTESGAIPASLEHRPVLTQEMVAVLPPGSHVPPGPMRLAALARFPLVSTPRGTSTRNLIEEAFARRKLRPHVVVETAQRDALLPLVLAGAGAAVVPRVAAAGAAEAGARVTELSPALTRDVVLVHRNTGLTAAAQAFLQVVEDG